MKVAIVVCCVLAISALCDGVELRSFLGSTAGGPVATFPLTTNCSDYSAYFNGTYSVESFSIVNNTVAKISVASAGPNPFKVYLVRGLFTGGFDSNATNCTRMTMLDRQVFYAAQNALETAIYLTRGFYSLVITGTPIEAIVGTTGPVFTTAAVTPVTTGASPVETTSSVADTTASADMSTTDGSGTTAHTDMSSGAAVTGAGAVTSAHADTTAAGSTTGHADTTAAASTTVHADTTVAASTTGHADTTVVGSTTAHADTTVAGSTTAHADTTVAASTTGVAATTVAASTAGMAATTAAAITTVHPDTTVAASTTGVVATTVAASTTGVAATTAAAITTVHADTTVAASTAAATTGAGSTSGVASASSDPRPFTKRSSMVGDAIYGMVQGPGFYYGGRIYLADGISTINDDYQWDRPSYPEYLDCDDDAQPPQNDTYVPFDLSDLDTSFDYDIRAVIVSAGDYRSTAFNGQLVGSTYDPSSSTIPQFFSPSPKSSRSCDRGYYYYAREAFGRTNWTAEANETFISAEFLQYDIPSDFVLLVWPMEQRAGDSVVAYFAEPTTLMSYTSYGFTHPTNITYNSSGVDQCSPMDDDEDLYYLSQTFTVTRNTSSPYTPIVSFATDGGFSWDNQGSSYYTIGSVSAAYLYNDEVNDYPTSYPCLGLLTADDLVGTTSVALVNATYNFTFQAVYIGTNVSRYFAYQVFVGSDPEVIPNNTATGDVITGSASSTTLSGDASSSTTGRVSISTTDSTTLGSTGVQTTGVQTTGVQTTGAPSTTGSFVTSAVGSTGVLTTATASVSTTGDFNIPASVRIFFRIRDIEAWNANLTASRASFLRYTAINMEVDNSDSHLSIKSITYTNNRKRAVQDANIEVGIAPSANARSPSEQARLYVNKVTANPTAVDYGTLGTPVSANVVANAPTPSPSQQGDAPSSKKLSGGAIAGIVIGCIVFVAILVVLGVFLYRRRPESQGYSNNGASLPTRGNPYYKDVPMTGV